MDGGSAPAILSVERIDFQTTKVTFKLTKDSIGQYPYLLAHSPQMTYYGPDVGVAIADFDSDTGLGWGTIPTYWGTNYQIKFWSAYDSGEVDPEAGEHTVTPPPPADPTDFLNYSVADGGHPSVYGTWQRNEGGFAERQWYYGDKPNDAPTLIDDYGATSPGLQGRGTDVQYPGAHRIGVQNFIIDPDNDFRETRSGIFSGSPVVVKPPPPSAPSYVQVMHDTTPDDIRVTVMEDNRPFARTGYELQREDVSKHDWHTIWFGSPASDDETSQDVIDAAVPIGPTYRYRVRAVAPDVDGNLIDGDWIEGGDVVTQHHYFVSWNGNAGGGNNQTTNIALYYGVGEQPSLFKDGRRYQGMSAMITFVLPTGMHWMSGNSQSWTWNCSSSYNVLYDDSLGTGTYGVTYTITDGGASVGSGTLYLRVT